jgi:Synergist-CTERM protein sorting domain-containing protein
MKGKSRVVVSVLLSVFLLCGAAAADLVYTVIDDNAQSGSLGIIDDTLNAASTGVPTTGDPAVFSFLDGEETRVALVDHDSWGASGGDVVTIYDPDGGWAALTPPNYRWGALATNIHDMEAWNGKLYSANNGCYLPSQAGAITVASISDYQITSENYKYEDASGDYLSHAVRVLFFNGNFYALFSLANSDFNYKESKVVKLDGDLNFIKEFDVGKNAADMVVWNGKIAVAYLGGYQESGTVGGINVIDLSQEEPEDAVTSLNLGTDSGEIKSLCVVGSDLYFVGLKYDAIYNGQGTLYKWTGSKTKVKEADSATYHFTCYQVVYDPKLEALVAALGSQVFVIDPSDNTIKKTFSAVDLGGNIASIAVVAKASAPESGGSGGGCNAGLMAFAALLLVLPLALRKKSR